MKKRISFIGKSIPRKSQSGNSVRLNNIDKTENSDIAEKLFLYSELRDRLTSEHKKFLREELEALEKEVRNETADERDQFWRAKIDEIFKITKEVLQERCKGTRVNCYETYQEIKKKYLGGKHE